MYLDAGITGSVQSLARNGRLTYASIPGVAVPVPAFRVYTFVVDEGSTARPAQPFAHPRVRRHRAASDGGHAAGCVLDERSMERRFGAFSRPRVTATIGTARARNLRPNLLAVVSEAVAWIPGYHGGYLGDGNGS